MKNTAGHAGRLFARFPWAQRAGVAVMVALMSPLLVAMTGLAIDVGYWYQQQESLQSAADAAAMAAVQAQILNGQSNVSTQASALPFAESAANAVDKGKYTFTSSTLTIQPSTVTLNGQSGTQWVATVTTSRRSFFSGIKGLGLPGEPAGTQSATATADYVPVQTPDCLLTTGTSGTDIATSGAGLVEGVNCGIGSDSTSASSVAVTGGSGVIEGSSVNTAGNVSISGSNGFIGQTTSSPDFGTESGNTGVTAPPDPLSALDPADTASSSNLPWQNYNFSTMAAPWTSQIGTNAAFPASSAFKTYSCCTEPAGAYDGMSNINNASNALNSGTPGTTFITGGIGGSDGDSTTLFGSTYYIAGGFATNCWGQSPGLVLQGSLYNPPRQPL
jgi:Flp pilus assembly protein TadG